MRGKGASLTIPLTGIKGIGPTTAGRLRKAGIVDARDLAAADVRRLAAESGLPISSLRRWKSAAKKL